MQRILLISSRVCPTSTRTFLIRINSGCPTNASTATRRTQITLVGEAPVLNMSALEGLARSREGYMSIKGISTSEGATGLHCRAKALGSCPNIARNGY